MDFYDQSYGLLFLIIPLLILGEIFLHLYWKKAFDRAGSFAFWRGLLRFSNTAFLLRRAGLYLAIVLMVFALMRPRWGARFSFEKESGVDIAIALDISPSMNAEDIQPSRLKRVIDELGALLSQLDGNRIGLVLFSGAAFVQCPLTGDLSALRLFLEKSHSDMINLKGTNIEDALKKSRSLLRSRFKRNRVIILVTDGEAHEGNAPSQAARIYKEDKIQIHTIGIGTLKGARVPNQTEVGDTLDRSMYKKDKKGQYIRSRLNAAGLRRIAKSGGGSYHRLGGKAFDSAALAGKIKNMEKSLIKDRRQMQLVERYPVFLAGGLFLLLCFLITNDRGKRNA